MRRVAVVLGLLLTVFPGAAPALDRQGMGVIGGGAGAGFMGGAPALFYSDARTRLTFRGQARYLLNNHWSLTGSAGYAWNSYLGKYNTDAKQTEDTLLVITPVEVGLMYSFGADYRAHRPYVGVQLGMYRWEFVSNAPHGLRQVARDKSISQDLDHTYFGYGFTVGHEYLWRDNASVNVELGWHHINANDTQRYSTEWARRFLSVLNLVEIRAGFNYYFPLAGSARRVAAAGPGAAAHADSAKAAPVVKGTLKPDVQKENIQIVPEAEDVGGAKAAPRPATPAPAPPAPPSTPAQPAAPDTTAGK